MQVDLTAVWESDDVGTLLMFASVITLFAIFSKVVGSGVPALMVGFSRIGSWRVGLGMLPRGEVALIVAEIGRASGIIDTDVFTVVIIMTVVTTVIAPILLVKAFPKVEQTAGGPSPSEEHALHAHHTRD